MGKPDGIVFNRDFWKRNDDPRAYAPHLKREFVVRETMHLLRLKGVNVGPVIFDFGAGSEPITEPLLEDEHGDTRTIVAVDFLKPKDERYLHVDADVNLVTQPETFAYRRRLAEVCKKLGIDPRTQENGVADLLVFSDILNYVPYRDVIKASVPFLKPGGIIFIFNQPGRTFDFAVNDLPAYGVQSNTDLIAFLEDPSLGLEHVFPPQFSGTRIGSQIPPAVLIVMRKKA